MKQRRNYFKQLAADYSLPVPLAARDGGQVCWVRCAFPANDLGKHQASKKQKGRFASRRFLSRNRSASQAPLDSVNLKPEPADGWSDDWACATPAPDESWEQYAESQRRRSFVTKFFVSYSTQDQEFVMELLNIIKAVGAESWFAPESIRIAKAYDKEIAEGLESSEWFILVMSQNSAASEWVKGEVKWALEKRRDRIIPILIADCDAASFNPGLLRIQHIDFRINAVEARARLIAKLVEVIYDLPRAAAITGNWKGMVHQDPGLKEGAVEYHTQFTVSVCRGKVTGLVVSHNLKDEARQFNCRVTGGVSYDRFVQLQYELEDPSIIHFGAILAVLNSEGNKMKGKFVGYVAFSEEIISGNVDVVKSGSGA
jgi:hypothetical protein